MYDVYLLANLLLKDVLVNKVKMNHEDYRAAAPTRLPV